MSNSELELKLACVRCVGSRHLFEGNPTFGFGPCAYCGRAPAASLVAISERGEERLRALALRPASVDDPTGRSVEDVVRRNLGSANPSFVDDLLSILNLSTQSNALRPDSRWLWYFDSQNPSAGDAEWERFKDRLLTGSRFFNVGVKEFLDDLFAPLDRLTAGGLVYEERPTRELGAGQELYRARCANSKTELEEIVGGIPHTLHAPPPWKARAGRMNVERLPAFYAALAPDTAIAETRPHIGSDVVVGTFKITRALKMLDFTVLHRSGGVTYSIWDGEFRKKSSLRALLLSFQSRIGSPVPPGQEYEYLVTQVVADYVHSNLRFDGLMFRSVQEKGGTNVVLFYSALGGFVRGAGYPSAPLFFVPDSAGIHKVERIEVIAPLRIRVGPATVS